MKLKLKPQWREFFLKHKKNIEKTLQTLDYQNKTILPPKNQIFRAFEYFDLSDTKLLILGQDPYPGHDGNFYYAEGLSFSVNPLVKKLPGSLKNIFKELKNCYSDFSYVNGSLINWMEKENIMLLNSSLTVEAGKPNSHASKWKDITDKVIQELDENSECLFLLMGGNAIDKSKLIKNKNRIITCVHPSPLSAHRGFFGSKVFLKVNQKLKELHKKEINWNLN